MTNKRRPRILVLCDEAWNDDTHANNVLSNWFDGMDADFANIYCSPGIPKNNCCKTYFQITDKMIAKSIFTNTRAGRVLPAQQLPASAERVDSRLYQGLKRITTDFLRMVREYLWLAGRYDMPAVKRFIDDFDPDIIFSARKATLKILRLERIVHGFSGAPFIAFTGDDEYALRQLKFSLFYWLVRFQRRSSLKQNTAFYKLYYSLSREQALDYHRKFNIPTAVLNKCGEFKNRCAHQKIHRPIRIVYAGKLYCHRWKTLAGIGRALKTINADQTHMVLDIYTLDTPTKRQRMLLHDGKNIFLQGGAAPEQLEAIYAHADIALHVESFDLKYRLQTRLSFSTKIIDCLATGCAVMAACWDQHAGYTYLKQENAAILIDDEKTILPVLNDMVNHPDRILTYAERAIDCGIRNHEKEMVQATLLKTFKQMAGDEDSD